MRGYVPAVAYWGLRDYGTAQWEGGEDGCDHSNGMDRNDSGKREGALTGGSLPGGVKYFRDTCGKCGAKRIDSQLGLERTPEEYVARMVEVFREVRRVLRKDGTLWLNLGDSYAGSGKGQTDNGCADPKVRKTQGMKLDIGQIPVGLKPKDLCGIPWRVARALQEPYYTGKIKDERDRVWLAAMIDGEGCMFIHKRKTGNLHSTYEKKDGTISKYNRNNDTFGAGLEVASTDRIIAEECLRITGVGSICQQTPEQNPTRKQIIYRWNVRSNECRWILQELYPHFVSKKQEARLVIGCPSSGDKAEAAHESLKAIHQGGQTTIDFPVPTSMFEEGWYLRSDIIWAKKNCMPESVTDRPTKSHEYMFLLTKASSYFYDADAIQERATGFDGRRDTLYKGGPKDMACGAHERWKRKNDNTNHGGNGTGFQNHSGYSEMENPYVRNKRSVWTVSTAPYPEAHFATYPPDLIKPCILAGTSAKGCCAKCGSPWERVVERRSGFTNGICNGCGEPESKHIQSDKSNMVSRRGEIVPCGSSKTIGWQPTCECSSKVNWKIGVYANAQQANQTIPCTVLDPFAGSGTTGQVALELARKAILIELNPEYVELIRQRCNVTPGLALA